MDLGNFAGRRCGPNPPSSLSCARAPGYAGCRAAVLKLLARVCFGVSSHAWSAVAAGSRLVAVGGVEKMTSSRRPKVAEILPALAIGGEVKLARRFPPGFA